MKGELSTNMDTPSPAGGFMDKVASLSGRMGGLPGGERTMASLALLATLVAATIVLILWTSAKNYVPLYGNQEHYDKAGIVEILDNEQFPFRIDTDSGNIMVPQDKLADARITLAARGIKAAMPEGLASMDGKVTMGTSQFMETKQYQHALEGELARTIINMDGVQNSRVHLAVPKRSLFIGRDEQKVTASVMVDLAPGHDLTTSQVEAIVSLITGSVPGMDARSVSVVDQRGNLLSGHLTEDTPVGKDTNKKLTFIEKLERNIEQRASNMLLPILGEGNFRIQVSSQVDFSVVEETRESVDPNTVMMNEKSRTDSSLDQLAMGIPGSLANRPPQQAGENEGENQRTTELSEIQRQFETGRAVTHTQYEVGRLTSMSVSVLINDGVAATSTGWTQAQLDKFGQMVKTATGFHSERGDQFNIASFSFVEAIPAGAEDGLPWWQMAVVQEYARYLFATLIALALILFGVRPLVAHLIKGKSQSGSDATLAVAGNSQDPTDSTAQAMDSHMTTSAATRVEGQIEADAENAMAMSLPDSESAFSEQLRHMQFLAGKESERVSAVLRYWIQEGVDIETRNS